jgi:hypothetical protein
MSMHTEPRGLFGQIWSVVLPQDEHREVVSKHRCVARHMQGRRLPDVDTLAHVQGDGVTACTTLGLPVGLGIAVRQSAGPVRVGRHLHLLPALVLLHFHAGAWGHVERVRPMPARCRRRCRHRHIEQVEVGTNPGTGI